MKRLMTILILFGIVMMVTPGVAIADIYMKQKQHTDATQMMGVAQPAKDVVSEIWITEKGFRSDDPDHSTIMKANAQKVIIIDHKTKTYMEQPLNMDDMMGNMSEGESAEDKAAMRQMMQNMMKMDAAVTDTGEQKTINGWKCRKYILKMNTAMGAITNRPLALASGMGLNAVVTFSIIGFQQANVPWQVGMAVIFIEGAIIFGLVVTGFREAVMNSISPSMKHAIAAGIGLFIAFIGLQNAGLIVKDPGTAVRLNPPDAAARNNRAEALLALGCPRLARREIELARVLAAGGPLSATVEATARAIASHEIGDVAGCPPD